MEPAAVTAIAVMDMGELHVSEYAPRIFDRRRVTNIQTDWEGLRESTS